MAFEDWEEMEGNRRGTPELYTSVGRNVHLSPVAHIRAHATRCRVYPRDAGSPMVD